MTTRRLINPNIANQFSIPLDTDINMGYAANDNSNSLGNQHTQFGSWILNLPSDGTASGGSGGTSGGGGSDDDDDTDDDTDDGSDVRRQLMRLRACPGGGGSGTAETESENSSWKLTLNSCLILLFAAVI